MLTFQKRKRNAGPYGQLIKYGGAALDQVWKHAKKAKVAQQAGVLSRVMAPRPGAPMGAPAKAAASIVSKQHDVNIKYRKKKTRAQRIRKKIARRRQNRFRRKIKKALKSPSFKQALTWNIGRSYKSFSNGQNVLFLPLCGYRGTNATTASVAAGAAGALSPSFRSDIVQQVVNLYAAKVLYPSTAASNSAINNWWIWFQRATMDLSVTNTGYAEATNPTNNEIEYDIYYMYPRHSYNEDVNANDVLNYDDAALGQEQGYADVALSALTIQNAAWEPYTRPYARKWYGCKKIANGYLGEGETFRMNKSAKINHLVTKRMWEAEDSVGTTRKQALRRGFPGALLIAWRGCPQNTASGVTGGYTQGRLTVNVNHAVYCSLPGVNQYGGNTRLLFTDDYA